MVSSRAFLLVAVEKNDPRKLEQCTLVGKWMVVSLIFCSWRWWNSFRGSYEDPSLCHTTHELIFLLQPVSLADWPLVSFPLCLWFWNVYSFHTGVRQRYVCAHLCSWCDLKDSKFRESPPIKILQGLWKNSKPQCRLETVWLQPKMSRTTVKSIYQSSWLSP